MNTDTNGKPEVIALDAVVVGAGFAGLYAMHKLRNELGLTVQGFDNAGDVGGTWYWNRYPGARSDTEVSAYCYSFDRELFESWQWSERYPRQSEILAYLQEVARKHDLRRDYRFETTVTTAAFDEATNRWEVLSSDGQRWSTRFLIEGVGLLSSTNVPSFPGQDKFPGEIYHTARWPQEGVGFAGKRVGVVGTGSSGVQVITEVAPVADHLTVFQRTPQYIVPAKHGPLDPDLLESISGDYDGYWQNVLNTVTAFGFPESDRSAESVSEAERNEVFRQQWEAGGGFQYMFATFNDIGTSRISNDAATAMVRSKISEIVSDPDVARKLQPTDLYAKRPVCCDNYYETFNRDNVRLVSVKEDPLIEITANGIRTATEEFELDVIVFATGFDAVTGNYLKIDQRGRRGLSLKEKWADRPLALMGVMTADFPNMFMIFGPMGPFTNQPPAHEVQVNWIAGAIQKVLADDAGIIEATRHAEAQWVATCDDIANQTLFPEVDSWINGANVPGKPVTVMFYMAGMQNYMDLLKSSVENGYEGFATSDKTATSSTTKVASL